MLLLFTLLDAFTLFAFFIQRTELIWVGRVFITITP